ncbi:hypothetical protein BJ741DRAFT_602939, partial [Chytriomyces cf. hyalinus JEL632]
MKSAALFVATCLTLAVTTVAGPLPYVLCVSACNAGWVSCYAGAGLVAGTVTAGLGAPAAAMMCNAAQAACMTACGGTLLAPDPSWACTVM